MTRPNHPFIVTKVTAHGFGWTQDEFEKGMQDFTASLNQQEPPAFLTSDGTVYVGDDSGENWWPVYVPEDEDRAGVRVGEGDAK